LKAYLNTYYNQRDRIGHNDSDDNRSALEHGIKRQTAINSERMQNHLEEGSHERSKSEKMLLSKYTKEELLDIIHELTTNK
jgi:hypothetical protein